ncbi:MULTISPECIES: polysaccharide deacetylase family protein [Photobacterium]|uniref:Polysaccharide deacetylase n=1 Tax=Photobacterium malacitanum TaxID=2204294 RepID=A0A1Y6MQK4_9GAMM|nr:MULTISPECIES: polysaccharide deacetylase family protein [Photobacterium]SMY38159.1 Polysaccharide deacetylase [Photobacterium malacitanum]
MIIDITKKNIFRILSNDFRVKSRLQLLTDNSILTILNFHRVAPFDGSIYSPLDPVLFEDIIIYLKLNYNIILFGETGEDKNKPDLILSFDDGYKDFIDYAVPILYKHNIKVNQNIIPSCVLSGESPINVYLQDFIGNAPDELILNLPIRPSITRKDLQNRNKLGYYISSKIKNLDYNNFIIHQKLIKDYIYKYSEFLCSAMMTIDEIKEVSTYHQIGVHSYEHLSMSKQSQKYFINDLNMCRDFMNDINIKTDIYAFPNGSATEENIQYALESDFNHILLVGDDFSKNNNKIHNRFTFDAISYFEAKYKSLGRMRNIKKLVA